MIFKFYKHMLTINIEGHTKDFAGSVGLLGEYGTGDMHDRKGRITDNFEEFAFEWQVRPDVDPKLVREDSAPQLPNERCRMPSTSRPNRRQLRADWVMHEKAEVAKPRRDFELCVDDIMMTGDIGLAEAWE